MRLFWDLAELLMLASKYSLVTLSHWGQATHTLRNPQGPFLVVALGVVLTLCSPKVSSSVTIHSQSNFLLLAIQT